MPIAKLIIAIKLRECINDSLRESLYQCQCRGHGTNVEAEDVSSGVSVTLLKLPLLRGPSLPCLLPSEPLCVVTERK